MIKAVIFDFDGVIADTQKSVFKILTDVCREMGVKFYRSLPEFLRSHSGNYREFYLKLGIKEKDFGKANLLYKKYFPRFEKEMRPHGEIGSVLAALKKRGIKIGIASNAHEFVIRRLLKRWGFEKYVDAVVGGEDMEKLKPDPAQILLAMEKLGARRSETAFVGDMEVDMQAGKAAKVAKVIAVTYGYHQEERLMKFRPDAIVSSPQEILENI